MKETKTREHWLQLIKKNKKTNKDSVVEIRNNRTQVKLISVNDQSGRKKNKDVRKFEEVGSQMFHRKG